MKYVATIAVAGLGIILLIQNLTAAGPSPSPRSVPVIVQDVMQPSRMVTVSAAATPNVPMQPTISLDVGQVFILTAATLDSVNNSVRILRGSTVVDRLRSFRANGGATDSHHTFPTGVRFPRDTNGLADIWVATDPSSGADMLLHGYITDDF